MVVKVVKITLLHLGQAGIAIHTVVGDDPCSGEDSNTLPFQGRSGQVVRHAVAV